MKSTFTILWCIRLAFDANCVYITSFILDVLLFLWAAPYGFGHSGWYNKSWPYWIFQIVAIISVLMAIFAIIQLITKNSSAGSRHGTYVQCRLYTIILMAIGGVVLFLLAMFYYKDYNTNQKLNWALEYASPLFFTAAA